MRFKILAINGDTRKIYSPHVQAAAVATIAFTVNGRSKLADAAAAAVVARSLRTRLFSPSSSSPPPRARALSFARICEWTRARAPRNGRHSNERASERAAKTPSSRRVVTATTAERAVRGGARRPHERQSLANGQICGKRSPPFALWSVCGGRSRLPLHVLLATSGANCKRAPKRKNSTLSFSSADYWALQVVDEKF